MRLPGSQAHPTEVSLAVLVFAYHMVTASILLNCDMAFGTFLYIKKKAFSLLYFDKRDKSLNLTHSNSSWNILRFISELCMSSNNMWTDTTVYREIFARFIFYLCALVVSGQILNLKNSNLFKLNCIWENSSWDDTVLQVQKCKNYMGSKITLYTAFFYVLLHGHYRLFWQYKSILHVPLFPI